MKRLVLFFFIFSAVLFSFGANAQTAAPADYFAGKWSVVAEGTPNGDAKMIVSLERKGGQLSGVILDAATNTEISKIDKIEETEKSITVYFVGGGYEVFLLLEKKDDDHVAGSLMNMFDAKGERVKEAK